MSRPLRIERAGGCEIILSGLAGIAFAALAMKASFILLKVLIRRGHTDFTLRRLPITTVRVLVAE